MPLITVRQLSLAIGHHTLLDQVNFTLEKGERVCIVGRNGVGKSTFLKILQGRAPYDRGEVVVEKGIKICSLTQEVPPETTGSVFDHVLSGLGDASHILRCYHALTHQAELSTSDLETLAHLQTEIENQSLWNAQQRVEETLTRLGLDGTRAFESLSGGFKRRVLLAQAWVSEPDILLLDEPTNHLDLNSIEWLENCLQNNTTTLIFITHDRRFLKKLATRIVELDRGILTSYPGHYERYLQTKEANLLANAHHQAIFEKKLAEEEAWIRQGIKARRTRNEGRVTALEKMREAKKAIRAQIGTATLKATLEKKSGKIVLQAENVGFAYPKETPLFENLSLIIERGEKIGIIGNNGVGKSTLVRVLLGQLAPTSGQLKLGTHLEVAYFDQIREQIDPHLSLLDNVALGRTFISFNGQSMHAYSYLQQFLFTPERARSPASALSGGEKNRLLLAKILSLPNNLLVMDEPTNDLDLETLDVLESLLVSYPGTLILISHDRTFLDNVVTSTIAFDHDGVPREYVGGYEDWLQQRPKIKSPPSTTLGKKYQPPTITPGLSAQEKKRYASLPSEIEALEKKMIALTSILGDPAFYTEPPEIISHKQQELKHLEQAFEALYTLWEDLERKQS